MASRAVRLYLLPAILLLAVSWSASADPESTVETKALPAETAGPAITLTPDQQTLLAIQEAGRSSVAEVLRRMEGVPPGPALENLHAQIAQIKRDTEVLFLTTLAGIARANGDEPTALQAEAVRDQILHPAPPAGSTVPQTPDKSKAAEGVKP